MTVFEPNNGHSDLPTIPMPANVATAASSSPYFLLRDLVGGAARLARAFGAARSERAFGGAVAGGAAAITSGRPTILKGAGSGQGVAGTTSETSSGAKSLEGATATSGVGTSANRACAVGL